jgi:ElaB/YqjD/DUF883 family membrane-anchored ribosome-binding protein
MSPDNPQSGKRGPKPGGRSGDDRTMGAEFGSDAPSGFDIDPLTPAASSVTDRTSSGVDSPEFGTTVGGTSYGTSGEGPVGARRSDAGQQASGLLNQVRQKATSQLNEQKARATDSLDSVAEAVRQSTRQLRDQQFDTVAQVVERAADQIERLTNHLRERDLNELVAEAQQFARQQPAMFIGSSFAAGLLAARFIKASRPAESYGSRALGPYGGTDTLAASGAERGTTSGSATSSDGGASSGRTSSYSTSVDRPGDVTGRGEL